MPNKRALSTSIELALSPLEAFEILVEELVMELERMGIIFASGANGSVVEGETSIGQVLAWQPSEHILLEWRPANWEPTETLQVELRLEPTGHSTQVNLDIRGWGGLIGDPGELAGWFAGQVAAPLFRAISPAAFGDWLTDRRARRPSGAQARQTYRDPLYHYPNFYVILDMLALSPDDYLLEVGCGGGAFLKLALESGCQAAAIDHSPDMVRLARRENQSAITEGRLEIRHASASHLPFPDRSFTCGAMTGVLGFLDDPVQAFREIRRVLVEGGRFVALGSDPEMKGTPAVPEPMASRLRFYTSHEFEDLARQAGFGELRVVRRDLEEYARQVGVPGEHLPLFAGPGTQFLLAVK